MDADPVGATSLAPLFVIGGGVLAIKCVRINELLLAIGGGVLVVFKSTKPEDTKKKIDSSNDDSKLVQKVENNKEDNLTPVNSKIEDNDSQQ